MTDDDHRGVIEPRQPAHYGQIVGKVAVPCKRRVVSEQRVDIILAVGPFGMAGDLTFPPGGQRAVEIVQQLGRLVVQGLGFGGNVHFLIGPCQCAQLFRLAFDLGQGFFEIQILRHEILRQCCHVYGRSCGAMQCHAPICKRG